MDEEFLLEALRWMLLSRLYDERATALQRQGRLGVYSPVLGQEASVVGSCMTLDPSQDWLVPQYRELVAYVHHGHPLERITANYFGKVLSGRIPDGVKLLPNQVALAAQLQHATGLAWGLKLQKKEGIVMTYIGEGGSSEGDFHEALNLAGVTGAPVVFFLQNNQWAISTPRRLQSAATSLALRAQGYGFEGVQVDGNDVMAVYQVTKEAVDKARQGGGPTLIESHTYRMSFHNTTDNPERYRDPKEYEEAKTRDPIQRVTAYLAKLGLWDEARESAMRASVEQQIDEAVAAATAFPAPEPGQVFENVYATLTPRLAAQRAELVK
jgi:pyruvate dehydrogenase E1 component alpha subunit